MAGVVKKLNKLKGGVANFKGNKKLEWPLVIHNLTKDLNLFALLLSSTALKSVTPPFCRM